MLGHERLVHRLASNYLTLFKDGKWSIIHKKEFSIERALHRQNMFPN